MAATLREQLHKQCATLFDRTMPANHIFDDDIVYAFGPGQSVFKIERETRPGGTFYVVSWIKPGKLKWETDWHSTSPAQPNAADCTPPATLVQKIATAIPAPEGWAWGVVEDGQIQEIVMFSWSDVGDRHADQRPGAPFMVVRDRAQHNLGSQLYQNDWIDLRTFWKLVRSGRLVDIRPHMQRTDSPRLGRKDKRWCAVLDGTVLALPELWDKYGNLSAADLQRVRAMPRS